MNKRRVGSTDCGLFAIVYTVDILYDLIYDEGKTRERLSACFEKQKFISFPLYVKNRETVVTYKETTSSWNKPKRSTRLKSKTMQNLTNKINLLNNLETNGADSQKIDINKSIEIPSKVVKKKTFAYIKTSDTICNISLTKLRESEISPLKKDYISVPRRRNLKKSNFWTIFISSAEK